MKQIHINQPPPTRGQKAKAFIVENFLTRLNVLLYISLILSGACYLFLPLVYALIPFYLHCIILFISYYKHIVKKARNNKIWAAYVERYGNKDGVIPREIRLAHEKKIRNGETIEL